VLISSITGTSSIFGFTGSTFSTGFTGAAGGSSLPSTFLLKDSAPYFINLFASFVCCSMSFALVNGNLLSIPGLCFIFLTG